MGMTTLVVQSWPAGAGPAWLETCLAGVAAWAAAAGFGYRRLGDELFEPLPGWALDAARGARMALTDLARLLWIARLLEGATRVVWLDADVLIFDAAAMILPDAASAVARERWIWIDRGVVRADERLSNAAMAFIRDDPLLDRYIDACTTILRGAPRPLNRTALGPQLLTALAVRRRIPLIAAVATLSPALMADLLGGGGPALADHAAHWPAPIAAAHLCRSLCGTRDAPDLVAAGVQARVVERLLCSPNPFVAAARR